MKIKEAVPEEKEKYSPGFYWHGDHNALIGYCHNYNRWAGYIRTRKPEREQELLLHLFKKVQGELPSKVVESGRTLNEAWYALNKTWRVLDTCAKQAYHQAGQVTQDAIEENYEAILALHEKECPHCPWNGETIFLKAETI
ncbi:MAG: hypothetical protein WD003_00940 [Candidatus Paceibacterota bacterium]